MEDYKIRVANEVESKEAQDLFFELGCKWLNGQASYYTGMTNLYLTLNNKQICTYDLDYNVDDYPESKELTIQQLRDLVVLKRGDVGDAQYVNAHGFKIYINSDNKVYYFEHRQFNNGQHHTWVESGINGRRPESLKDEYISELKPIEKTMKEYLVKDNIKNKYHLIKSEGLDVDGSDVIELPKGTELVVQYKDGTKGYFKDGCSLMHYTDNSWHRVSIPFAHIDASKLIWLKDGCQAYCDPKYSSKLPSPFNYVKKKETVSDGINREKPMNETEYLLQGKNGEHLKESISELKQPEELPFIDDEPIYQSPRERLDISTGYQLDVIGSHTYGSRGRNNGETDESYREYLRGFGKTDSINDQYAEIKKARKNSKLNEAMFDFKNTDHGAEFDNFELLSESKPHNHYFIDVSDIDDVDFYEIALRYNVTDPCIQHILKKCLAVGNRGHKDFQTDIRDIYDTAKRAIQIHGID